MAAPSNALLSRRIGVNLANNGLIRFHAMTRVPFRRVGDSSREDSAFPATLVPSKPLTTAITEEHPWTIRSRTEVRPWTLSTASAEGYPLTQRTARNLQRSGQYLKDAFG